MSRRLHRWLLAIALSPFSILITLYSTWLVAAFSLERWPRPYQDDPKFINGVVSLFHALAALNFLCLPVLVFLCIAMFCFGVFRWLDRHPGFTWRYFMFMLALCVCSWLVTVLTLKADPFRVLVWFFD